MPGLKGKVGGEKKQQREMGKYETSHPITHRNVPTRKCPPHSPPMTNRPVHSGQLRLVCKNGGGKGAVTHGE